MGNWKVGDRVAWDGYTGTVVGLWVNSVYPNGITVKPDDPKAPWGDVLPVHGYCWRFGEPETCLLKLGQEVTIQTVRRKETSKPCPNPTCAKPNDVGARVCWWCEGRLG